MNRKIKLALILIVLIGAGIALSYYIPFWMETQRTVEARDALAAHHRQNREAAQPGAAATEPPAEATASAAPQETEAATAAAPGGPTAAPAAETGTEEPAPEAKETSSEGPADTEAPATPEPMPEPTPEPTEEPTATPTGAPTPSPTPDRSVRTGPLPYPLKEKATMDPERILEELRDIYAINQDLVGWLTIPDTDIDYPVVQTADAESMDFYMDHDFYGEQNRNGALVLDFECDAYTPGYNLIISGHHLTNGMMFSYLTDFEKASFWEKHRTVQFDTLMERQTYVVVAAFRSAAYKDNERGFRYSANIQYKVECEQWLEEVFANQLYETGVDAEWGDFFLTLTTCNKIYHPEGRFVVVCRRLREGEVIDENLP